MLDEIYALGELFFLFQAEDGIRDVAVTGVQWFVPSRRRHTRCSRDWSSDVCSSDLAGQPAGIVKGYLDWIMSDVGQCIILDKGYAPAKTVTCG